ncbi:MAG TPA: PIN domain-containing protein [Anaerolineales bacterium]|nr:PIN domain-containing protein [Anaerolineales bacterium]
MSKFNIFLDSSALIAGAISETGAAHVLLQLGESEDILLTISEMVLVESERSIAKKSPRNLNDLRKLIKTAKLRIVNDPSKKEVEANLYLIEDPNDVPILLAAMKAKVDYLATHNRKHFLDDPKVAEKAGLKIGTPGDVLAWIRENLARE